MDWNSLLAAIGHGALKEGQIANRMQELYEKDHPRIVSDEEVLTQIAESAGQNRQMQQKGKSGIVVKGIHDVAVRLSRCCSPVPGDEIVGFITRGRGISIHRTDCINILNLPEIERPRLIEAEWEQQEKGAEGEKYAACLNLFAHDRSGLLADITKTLTERNVSIIALNTRTSKQGMATISISFEIAGREELTQIVSKLSSIPSIVDIERTVG